MTALKVLLTSWSEEPAYLLACDQLEGEFADRLDAAAVEVWDGERRKALPKEALA